MNILFLDECPGVSVKKILWLIECALLRCIVWKTDNNTNHYQDESTTSKKNVIENLKGGRNESLFQYKNQFLGTTLFIISSWYDLHIILHFYLLVWNHGCIQIMLFNNKMYTQFVEWFYWFVDYHDMTLFTLLLHCMCRT